MGEIMRKQVQRKAPVRREPTKECYKCHYRLPISKLSKRTIQLNTGSSGISLTVGKGFRNPRVNSGRQYYRKKQVFICGECKTQERKDFIRLLKGLALAGVLVGIGVAVWWAKNNPEVITNFFK